MGLRELKAERTRERISSTALDLFERHGFEQTTMEQIAEGAEIGIATLYRYFPTKDSVLLDPVVRGIGGLARLLDARPDDEPIDEALGHALHDFLIDDERSAARVRRLRAQLDRAQGPRARLWDLWAQERTLVEEAIARRTGVDPGELWVGVASHTTMMIAEMALDLRRSSTAHRSTSDYAAELIRLLHTDGAVIPRLP
jgi:AcrR family transcriptional regulator